GGRKTGRVAIALALGVTSRIVSDDSAERPLNATHASASNPDCAVVILEDALHAAPRDGRTECLAVLEAVQAIIGTHPQASVTATQQPVDARVGWERFLRQHGGYGHSVKPKQTANRNPNVAVACLSDHVRSVWEAVLDPPDCVRILGNQPVRIERRGSSGQEQQ